MSSKQLNFISTNQNSMMSSKQLNSISTNQHSTMPSKQLNSISTNQHSTMPSNLLKPLSTNQHSMKFSNQSNPFSMNPHLVSSYQFNPISSNENSVPSSKELNRLIALKFADDFGRHIMKYYNAHWVSIAFQFPEFNLEFKRIEEYLHVTDDLGRLVGIASVGRLITRLMYEKTNGFENLLQSLLSDSPLQGYLQIQRWATALVTSSNISIFIVCSMIAKICHGLIRCRAEDKVYILFFALADTIVEKNVVANSSDWTWFRKLAIAIIENKGYSEIDEHWRASRKC